MLTRVRWFLYGALATVGATTYLLVRVRRMRERLTRATVARATAAAIADTMELAGRRLAASGGRQRAAG
jgi:hypothetical protein